ncbi:transporter substrate-binding domain-containing protein [Amphritea sp.]|uniref:transporter substrate-binding domain-containing protein n=1 Tax=Amphritea sp. TaxID=1872502 RepID=UPI003A90BDD7
MKKIVPTEQGYPVGLLFSTESLTSPVENTQRQGSLLAIEEVNAAGGIHGQPLVPVTLSIGSQPEDYHAAAQQCIDQHGVQVLFGTHTSNARKAVLPLIENRHALLFYSTLYEGFEYSPNCIYTGAAPNQNIVQLAEYVITHYGKRVMFIGNNYVYAHESNRIMKELFESVEGELVECFYYPFGSKREQFLQAMRVAEKLQPDAIYSTVVGTDTIELYEAFAQSSLNSATTPIISVATNETDVQGMSSSAAAGHLVCAPYFSSLETKQSQQFVTRFQARFGKDAIVTAGAEASYFQVHLFAKAANMVQNLTINHIIDTMPNVSYLAPQGEVRIDASTNHTYLASRIAKISAVGQFDIIHQQDHVIQPIPYMLQYSTQNILAQ